MLRSKSWDEFSSTEMKWGYKFPSHSCIFPSLFCFWGSCSLEAHFSGLLDQSGNIHMLPEDLLCTQPCTDSRWKGLLPPKDQAGRPHLRPLRETYISLRASMPFVLSYCY